MQPVLYDQYDPLGALALPVVNQRPTVGQRYNNFGNLRSNDPFLGKQGQGKGGYDIYDTPEHGLRALARDLHTKSKRMNTIRELITVYAPPSDNNPTENYINFVAKEAGVSPDQEIDIAALRPALMRGIIKFENKNRDLADDQMLANAIAAADGEPSQMNNQYMGYFMDGQNAVASAAPALAQPSANMSQAALNDPMLGPFMDGRAAALEGSPSSLTRQQQLQVQKQQILNLIASIEPGQLTGLMAQIPPELRTDPDIVAAMQAKGLTGTSGGGGLLTTEAQASTNDPNMRYSGILGEIGKPSGIPSNRRDQSPMSYKPGIDMNDMLIRVGLAGVGASGQGGLEALGAMGREYGNIQDSNNQGLAAFQKAMAKGTKGGSGVGTSGSIIVNDSISRALPLIGEGWSTGFASYLKGIPGSDAQKLANNLKTIQANIGFDKLQAMRDASPTGGALGQVSERELGFLQSVFGSLDQSQTAEELQYNLQLLQYVYNSIVHGEGNHPYQMPVYGAGSAASGGLDADLQADIDKYANQ